MPDGLPYLSTKLRVESWRQVWCDLWSKAAFAGGIQQDIFCPKNQCIFYNNEEIYFFDTVHLSYRGSQIINKILLNRIDQINKLNLNFNNW